MPKSYSLDAICGRSRSIRLMVLSAGAVGFAVVAGCLDAGNPQTGDDLTSKVMQVLRELELVDESGRPAPDTQLSFEDIVDVPPGLADGVDQDTTYSSGAGLTVDGTEISIATGGITSSHIADNAINSTGIADGAVSTADLADGAVSTAAIAPNAVTPNHEFAEPGVAAAVNGLETALDSSIAPVLERTITAPAPGYALVLGTLQVNTAHTLGTFSTVIAGVSPTAGQFATGRALATQVPENAPTCLYVNTVTVQAIFPIADAGPETFYLLAQENSGQWSVSARSLSVVYFPTGYGNVDTP